MEKVLTEVIKFLVSNPEEVRIDVEREYKLVRFLVDVPKSERAKIIGNEGRVIRGLKSVIGAMGGKEGTDVELLIVE